MDNTVYITEGGRTAIGKIGGSLRNFPSEKLATLVVEDLISNRAKIAPEEVDHIILGEVKQRSLPSNLARYTALNTSLGEKVPGYTVHRQCGSGLQAIIDASEMILSGNADVVVAGGAESMSQSAYFIRNAGHGLGNGSVTIEDSLIEGGPGAIPEDQYGYMPMGMTAENLADRYEISREEQDIFSQRSQERMAKAIQEGYFKEQIIPVDTGNGKVFDTDEHPFLSNLEKLANLRPAFKKGGSVTAGNSSGRNDGGAAVLLMSGEKMKELGKAPLAKVIAGASSGCDPLVMGLGPVECTRIALEQAGLTINDMDVIELNEAFAAQSLAVLAEWAKWGISEEDLIAKVNPNGGAISHGHPLGCTGAALTVKCMYELKRRNLRYGLVTLCCAGGLGVAMLIENVDRA